MIMCLCTCAMCLCACACACVCEGTSALVKQLLQARTLVAVQHADRSISSWTCVCCACSFVLHVKVDQGGVGNILHLQPNSTHTHLKV